MLVFEVEQFKLHLNNHYTCQLINVENKLKNQLNTLLTLIFIEVKMTYEATKANKRKFMLRNYIFNQYSFSLLDNFKIFSLKTYNFYLYFPSILILF